jgi:DNA-3-methyladenine glycosylase
VNITIKNKEKIISGMKLNQDFYIRNSVTQIAQELLGKYIFTYIDNKLTAGIITETEAYAGIVDRASHAYNYRRTARTEVMYAQGGVAYVYLCYGVHHLFNVVTNQKEVPHAVLLRGIYPVSGIEIMEKRIGKKFKDKSFSDGPGKASKALGIRVINTGENLTGNKIWIEDKGVQVNKKDYTQGPRIGVIYAGKDALLPYRYLLTNEALTKVKKKAQQSTELF